MPRNSSPQESTPIPTNPHFRKASQGPYELGYLLRELPEHLSKDESDEVYLMAAAAGQHAGNCVGTLLFGLEAIGALMVKVGCSEEKELSDGLTLNLGALIEHLAVELHLLREVEGAMDSALARRPQHKKGGV